VTVIGFNICCSVPNFIKIGRFYTEIWWFSDLQNGGSPPSWICYDVTVLHRRTHLRCANIVLKFLVDRVWAWWGVKVWVSPLTCIVALTTLALPCNCVIPWLPHLSYLVYLLAQICHGTITLWKVAKRMYCINYLFRGAGVPASDIECVYTSIIRSVLEYACPVWHPGLTKSISKCGLVEFGNP